MFLKDVAWRGMTGYDLDAVAAIAAQVHPGFFESETVLAEKFSLYRNGCYLLEIGERPAGYVLSHPWRLGDLPALNTLLGQIPADADTYYLHDLALLPLARGVGVAGKIVAALTRHAEAMNFASMSLVAVNGSQPFWTRQGFAVADLPDLAEKLRGYEDAARYMVKALA